MRLALASLTRMRGRPRSSRNRWLCSRRRRSLSSDMDCFGRDDIENNGQRGEKSGEVMGGESERVHGIRRV